MTRLHIGLWGTMALLSALWLAADPDIVHAPTFFALRSGMVQYTGIIAMACMSVAMVLALRPRWPEGWFDGLDKMYRLHKWLGIAALTVSVIHWAWRKFPQWALAWGWLQRPPARSGPRPVPDNVIEQVLRTVREPAQSLGEWAFYAAVVLIVLALLRYFPYRWFFKTHRLLAVTYLVFVFHSVVLMKFAYWATPMGVVMAVLMIAGTWSAGVALMRKVGASRQVHGTITDLRYSPESQTLETRIELSSGWPGHHAGQFAFAMSSRVEGPHPYTIASAWRPDRPGLTFVIKELGDHTRGLHERLRVGQAVRVEGPYGRFTFADTQPCQIWIGAGIGITPFIARMQQLAATSERPPQTIHLFHTIRTPDPSAIAALSAEAEAAGVILHVVAGSRDGRLDGQRIRDTVPQWRDASLWFCGPTAFGRALRTDFGALGVPVGQRFHQEMFSMR